MLRCARVLVLPGTLVAGWLLAGNLYAAEIEAAASQQDAANPVVDLFAGMDAGDIEAKVFARDSKHVNLLLENKTKEPVLVSVPAAVGVVPVMAQFMPWPDDNQQQNQQTQKVGATPQFPWQNGGNRGQQGPWNIGAGPLFSIPPEDTVKVKLTGMCLDHGLPSPRAKLPYAIRPIHQVANCPEVAALCVMVGKGQVNREIAQLAAWHFQNELSWEDFAAMRKKVAVGIAPKYTAAELAAAKEVAKAAEEFAKQMRTSDSTVSMR